MQKQLLVNAERKRKKAEKCHIECVATTWIDDKVDCNNNLRALVHSTAPMGVEVIYQLLVCVSVNVQ
jgi:hypothetical protein